MQYSTNLLRHMRCIIGSNIHYHRCRKKLSLQKLSKLTGIAPSTLDYYELGKDEIPLDILLKIACALDVTLDALIRQSPTR